MHVVNWKFSRSPSEEICTSSMHLVACWIDIKQKSNYWKLLKLFSFFLIKEAFFFEENGKMLMTKFQETCSIFSFSTFNFQRFKVEISDILLYASDSLFRLIFCTGKCASFFLPILGKNSWDCRIPFCFIQSLRHKFILP